MSKNNLWTPETLEVSRELYILYGIEVNEPVSRAELEAFKRESLEDFLP